MSCNDYCCNYGCNQGRNCPARIASLRKIIERDAKPRRQWLENVLALLACLLGIYLGYLYQQSVVLVS